MIYSYWKGFKGFCTLANLLWLIDYSDWLFWYMIYNLWMIPLWRPSRLLSHFWLTNKVRLDFSPQFLLVLKRIFAAFLLERVWIRYSLKELSGTDAKAGLLFSIFFLFEKAFWKVLYWNLLYLYRCNLFLCRLNELVETKLRMWVGSISSLMMKLPIVWSYAHQ